MPSSRCESLTRRAETRASISTRNLTLKAMRHELGVSAEGQSGRSSHLPISNAGAARAEADLDMHGRKPREEATIQDRAAAVVALLRVLEVLPLCGKWASALRCRCMRKSRRAPGQRTPPASGPAVTRPTVRIFAPRGAGGTVAVSPVVVPFCRGHRDVARMGTVARAVHVSSTRLADRRQIDHLAWMWRTLLRSDSRRFRQRVTVPSIATVLPYSFCVLAAFDGRLSVEHRGGVDRIKATIERGRRGRRSRQRTPSMRA